MTTEIDHTPYLDMQDDPLHFWQQRIKACRWMITKTIALGTLAASLGVLGQGWLEHAAPLFPIISQNYGLWQAIYLLSLILIFLLWTAAMLQKIGLLQNSKQGLSMQQRIDEQNQRRADRLQAARERREAERAEREAAQSFFKLKSTRTSNKFDY